MTDLKASLRHAQGFHHSDRQDVAYCSGADESAGHTHTDQRYQSLGRQKAKSRHIAIVAATKVLATQWVCEITPQHQSRISSESEHFGSLDLYALAADEDLVDANFDEVHVVTAGTLTNEQVEQFRSHTQSLYLHTLSTSQPQPLLQSRAFNWTSESDLAAFLGSLFSAQENGIWITGSWEGFTQATINSVLRVIHSQEPALGDALSCLLDQLGKPTNTKSNSILLFARGDTNLTLGDLISAHDAVETHFPNACEVAVAFDRRLTTGGYRFLLLVPEASAAASYGGN